MSKLDTQTSEAHRHPGMEDIVAYYDQTVLDYRVLWLNGQNRAIHFGYHDAPDLSHARALLRLNEKLAELGQIEADQHILDAGCGVGGSSMWIASHIGARVTGITPVYSQVRKARSLATKRQLDARVSFQVGDYRNTPFEDNTFDVVWACESVCHAPEKADFYREAFRVLKPGGRLVMAEYVRMARPLSQRGEKILRRWLQGWAIRDIDTIEEHHDHMRHAGFSVFRTEDVTPYIKPSLKRLYRISSSLYPLAVLLKATKIRSPRQHGNVIGAVTQYKALKKKYWRYFLIQAIK